MGKLIASIFAMFFMLCVATAHPNATLPVLSTAAQTNVPYTPRIHLNLDMVRHITCTDAEGTGYGTGFMIRHNVVVTAAHVMRGTCIDTVTRIPMTPYLVDEERDFALVTFNANLPENVRVFQISCAGFVPGRTYQAVGFERGRFFVVTNLLAREDRTPPGYQLRGGRTAVGLRALHGDLIQGMSGGPIVDLQTGAVVGINSATNINALSRGFEMDIRAQGKPLALARELRDVPSVCRT